MNLPNHDFLSAPLWLITTLHIVTLTLHFAAMNFMVGGVIVILFGRLNDRWNDPTVRKFIKLFPSAMAATITFGVAPLLFVQLVYGGQVYSASIVSGWFWLMIVAVAIVCYYFLYGAAFASEGAHTRLKIYLSIALAGFIYISFVYSSVFSLAERPDLYMALYAGNQAGTVINPEIGSYIFRWLHMLLGAVTVGAFFVGWLGKENEQAYNAGKGFYLWGMVAAMLLGLFYLFSFGEHIVKFMRTPAVYWLLVSIVLSPGSLHFFFKKRFLPSGLMLLVSLVGMVIIRHYVRLMFLADHFSPSSLPVRPQWSIFILFLLCFAVAVWLIGYMLRLFFSSRQQTA
jgi:MFS family permease